MRLHPISWVMWALGAATCALLTRNPLYLVRIGLSAGLVMLTAGTRTQARSWQQLLKLGAVVWLVTIPFNALMLHAGKHVLLHLPQTWPLIGGNITLEAVLFGAAAGLALWVLLLIFSAFNIALDSSELIRLIPPAFYQVGLITSIGLTYVPQMLKSSLEIREAQRVRGHRFRSWRDTTPLVMPLVTSSLERAMQLAESMEARGFGGSGQEQTTRQQLFNSLLALCGMALLVAVLGIQLWLRQYPWWLVGLFVLALGLLGMAILRQSRAARRSRYRPRRWHSVDTLLTAGALIAAASMLAARIVGGTHLQYYPFPPNGLLPGFTPWVGVAMLFLALPALVSLALAPAPPSRRTEEGVPQ